MSGPLSHTSLPVPSPCLVCTRWTASLPAWCFFLATYLKEMEPHNHRKKTSETVSQSEVFLFWLDFSLSHKETGNLYWRRDQHQNPKCWGRSETGQPPLNLAGTVSDRQKVWRRNRVLILFFCSVWVCLLMLSKANCRPWFTYYPQLQGCSPKWKQRDSAVYNNRIDSLLVLETRNQSVGNAYRSAGSQGNSSLPSSIFQWLHVDRQGSLDLCSLIASSSSTDKIPFHIL